MASVEPEKKDQIFRAQKQIERTFYSPRTQRRAGSNIMQQPTQIEQLSPGVNKHTYGSPNRGKQNILNFQDQGGNDFMSKFGTAGGGAPLRDQYGNVIAARKPGVNENAPTNLNADQVRQMQKDQYQKDLQAQMAQKRMQKEQEKARQNQEDIEQENRIKQELNQLNQREQNQIIKERGGKPNEAARFKKFNETQNQNQQSYQMRPPSNLKQNQSNYQAVITSDQIDSHAVRQNDYINKQVLLQQGARVQAYQDNFMSVLSRDREVDQAHQEMIRIQQKLQTQIDVLKSEARSMKAQNDQIAQEMQKMLEKSALSRMQGRLNLDARDIKHQWSEVTYANPNSVRQSAMGIQKQRQPISFPQAKPGFMQAAGNILRSSQSVNVISGGNFYSEPLGQPSLLKVESSKVPVDQHITSRQQMHMIHPTSQIEQTFVTDFLREINDIEDINQRFQANMNERAVETNQKYAQKNSYTPIEDDLEVKINFLTRNPTSIVVDQDYDQPETYNQADFQYRPLIEKQDDLQQDLKQNYVDERVDENPRPADYHSKTPQRREQVYQHSREQSEIKGDSTFITSQMPEIPDKKPQTKQSNYKTVQQALTEQTKRNVSPPKMVPQQPYQPPKNDDGWLSDQYGEDDQQYQHIPDQKRGTTAEHFNRAH